MGFKRPSVVSSLVMCLIEVSNCLLRRRYFCIFSPFASEFRPVVVNLHWVIFDFLSILHLCSTEVWFSKVFSRRQLDVVYSAYQGVAQLSEC